ncbi:MAG TPA: hypothetical protein VMS99_00685 [Acidimicrobiia bacterium]|nr:hypothetical protein [Acidimicrobiia bacterium]
MRLLSAAIALALMLTACGENGAEPADGTQSGVGPGITVAEAIEGDFEVPVLVNGYLFVDTEGEVTLADMVLESYPPQPGGATLVVEGFDLPQVELQSHQGISWTDETIQVLGTVAAGKLAVDAQSSG